MAVTRRNLIAMMLVGFAVPAGVAEAFAQAGYPPPAPGQMPPTFGDAPRMNEELLRQQQIQRQQFDSFQRGQQIERDRNLDTLRRQQSGQSQSLNRLRQEQLDQERRRFGQQRLQVQGRRTRRPLTEAERERIDAATRRSSSRSSYSIIIEDPPVRRRRRRR